MAVCRGKFLYIAFIAAWFLTGCARPFVVPPGNAAFIPALNPDHAVMKDGYKLPLLDMESVDSTPRAIVLALHGLNDYSNAFRSLADELAGHEIKVIAYDQRGFGRSEGTGYWHGEAALTDDLRTMIELIGARYPRTPLFLLGESMGGAVILAALQPLADQTEVNGVILLAPAVWATSTMPFYQRFALWLFAHAFPSMTFSGKGLDIIASDNTAMLKALGKDPLVIKETRADVLHGLSILMDHAFTAASTIDYDTLILYGKNDQIIPRKPTCMMLENLPVRGGQNQNIHLILYPDGYHMLTRDLHASRVVEDIKAWVLNKDTTHGVPAYSADHEVQAFCAR